MTETQLSKKEVVRTIREYLEEELREAERAGDESRAAELNSLVTVYRMIPTRDYDAGDPIAPATLVELSLEGVTTFCYVAPRGGGLVTRVSGHPVQVITASSPLGEALMGKKAGDVAEVEIRGVVRRYQIKTVR